jgi:glycerol-3-phosphate O-acyltransferase / dihydroxyacetone phosphate acyltransferase
MIEQASPAIRWIARAVCFVFYRVDRVGRIPQDGAVLLLPNHPNALLDPTIIWATAGRDVRFLAKSTLFDGALRPILAGARAIPVYRKLDHGVDTTRNTETFAAVSEALAAGDAVCMFPEGLSHSTGRLEPLRTGAARMTLAAEHQGVPVALVPVGLNFDRKTIFRSRVIVVFGPPFSASDLTSNAEADDRAAVRTLTERIADRMRLLLVEADPQSDAGLVDRVDRLYAAARHVSWEPEERLARRRIIAAGIDRLRHADPERYERLLLRLRRYDERLQRFGLRDRHLDWHISSRDATIFAMREIALGIILLPLCALGLVTFFIPYWLTGQIAKRVAKKRDVLATAQVFTGAAVYAAWLVFVTAAAWSSGGRTAGMLTLGSMLLLAALGLFAIEREAAVMDAVRGWWLLRRAHRDTRERLRRHRSELADVLDEVYSWLAETSSTGTSGRKAPTYRS